MDFVNFSCPVISYVMVSLWTFSRWRQKSYAVNGILSRAKSLSETSLGTFWYMFLLTHFYFSWDSHREVVHFEPFLPHKRRRKCWKNECDTSHKLILRV